MPPKLKSVPGMVGIGVMVLHGEYDPDQAWLPFLSAVLTSRRTSLLSAAQAHEFFRAMDFPLIDYLGQSNMVRPTKAECMMYEVTGAAQYPLPFREFLRIGPREYSGLKAEKWPYFDRCPSNGWLVTRRNHHARWPQGDALLDWLHKNCRGRFYKPSRSRLVFACTSDATAFDAWVAKERTEIVDF